MNLNVCDKFCPSRATGDDVYTLRRIHTHTLSYIDTIILAGLRGAGLPASPGLVAYFHSIYNFPHNVHIFTPSIEQKWGWVGLGILQIPRQVKWEHEPPLLLTYIPSLTGN